MTTENPDRKAECVHKVEGGHNAPFYRTRENRADLLANLAADAIVEAEEKGLNPANLTLETSYHSSSIEPQLECGEVRVYRSHDTETE